MRTTTNNASTKKEANQMAFQYALYMMLGSYFNSAKAKSSFWEDKMYLYYCETGKDKQYQFEDMVLRYVKEKMKKDMPKDAWCENMKVYVFTYCEHCYMVFEGDKYKVYVRCDYRGKYTRLKYRWRRTTKRV